MMLDNPYKIVRQLASSNVVVLFSVSGCCMCTVAKRLLFGLGAGPTIIEFDHHGDGPYIQAILFHLVVDGRQFVPALFFDGKILGGIEALMGCHINARWFISLTLHKSKQIDASQPTGLQCTPKSSSTPLSTSVECSSSESSASLNYANNDASPCSYITNSFNDQLVPSGSKETRSSHQDVVRSLKGSCRLTSSVSKIAKPCGIKLPSPKFGFFEVITSITCLLVRRKNISQGKSSGDGNTKANKPIKEFPEFTKQIELLMEEYEKLVETKATQLRCSELREEVDALRNCSQSCRVMP